MTNSKWDELVRTTIRELGGDRVLIPGAKLKQRLIVASDSSTPLDDYLQAAKQSFSQLLEKVEGVQVRKRVGTDMLVGLHSASWPVVAPSDSATRRPEFRQDVYEALTRMTSLPYSYIPVMDEFRPDGAGYPDAIPLPAVTLTDLKNQRRLFADSIGDSEIRTTLLNALTDGENPLGSFYREVVQAGLGDRWHAFKFNLLSARLNEWANQHNLTVSPSWCSGREAPRRDSPQAILAKLAQFMSEQEIRSLNIPFRAVEAFYRTLTRKTS